MFFFTESISDDRESIISIERNKEINPEPLSTTPSPYLSREFYIEVLQYTKDKARFSIPTYSLSIKSRKREANQIEWSTLIYSYVIYFYYVPLCFHLVPMVNETERA